MFFIYKYRIINLLRVRAQLFWCLAFPVILGTFFYLSFGNIINSTEILNTIPVAVVEVKATEQGDNFKAMLDELAKEDAKYLDVKYTTLKEAEALLENSEVDGIIKIDETITLAVKGKGINESILKSIIDQYLQIEHTITAIAEERPQQLEAAIKAASQDISLNKEVFISNAAVDTIAQYFYVLIAMACMYGGFTGLDNTMTLQANLSSLGIRRCVAPTKKMKLMLGDFLAGVTMQFINVLILLAYLVFALRIDFGNQIGFILLTSFVGTLTGVAFGSTVGIVLKTGRGFKETIVAMSGVFLCFLAGMMYGDMGDIIEHKAPIINRINPAALLKDAFYCLNVFDNHNRYFRNIISLLVIAALMCVTSILIMRREKYASI